jgi:hypothetical protein
MRELQPARASAEVSALTAPAADLGRVRNLLAEASLGNTEWAGP